MTQNESIVSDYASEQEERFLEKLIFRNRFVVLALFALALDFYALGAPFIAALEVIVYAGAVITLFLFVVMLIGVDKPGSYGAQPGFQRVLTGIASRSVASLASSEPTFFTVIV